MSISLVVFATDMKLFDRLMIGLWINLGYLMFYFVISMVPVRQLNWLKKQNKQGVYKLQRKMVLLSMRFAQAMGVILCLSFLLNGLFGKDYQSIFATFIGTGIFLGATMAILKIETNH